MTNLRYSMFPNCLVFCDVKHVQSSVLGQNVMFGSVRSSVLLLYDQTSLVTYSWMFANCSVFCDVRHVQSSILGQNVMFGKFNIQTFNVRSVRSSVFWCSFQDYFWAKYDFMMLSSPHHYPDILLMRIAVSDVI